MPNEGISLLPKGIIHARTLINSIANESFINLSTKTPLWSETELLCKPFNGKLTYSRDNIEMVLEIDIGRTPDTGYLQEIMETLPIPTNYKYSLEPKALITVVREIAVTTNTTKHELANFFSDSIMVALVVTQTLLMNQVLTSDSVGVFFEMLPYPSEPWDFSELSRKILQQK